MDWTIPSDLGNGSILGYKIQKLNGTSAGEFSGAWYDFVANTNNTNTEYTDTSLILGDWYRYRVAGINEAGLGMFSGNQTSLSMAQANGTITMTIPATLTSHVGGDAFLSLIHI